MKLCTFYMSTIVFPGKCISSEIHFPISDSISCVRSISGYFSHGSRDSFVEGECAAIAGDIPNNFLLHFLGYFRGGRTKHVPSIHIPEYEIIDKVWSIYITRELKYT